MIARGAIGLEVAALAAFETVAAALAAPIARRTLAGFDLAFLLARFGIGDHLFIAVGLGFIFLIVAARTALGLLLLVTGAILLEHAEIMIGVLEIIFGLDAIAGELRVARQRLVFLKQLRRVAALAIVRPVAGVAGHALRALPTAAATTAALSIIDQLVCFPVALAPAVPDRR